MLKTCKKNYGLQWIHDYQLNTNILWPSYMPIKIN
jgi:hypothetical protein